MGTITIEKSMFFGEFSCSAYDLPALLAYQIEKPPERLLVDEPAPSLTISEREVSGRSNPSALDAARPKAAKAEAEKPRPLPVLRLFSEVTLNPPEKPARPFSLQVIAPILLVSAAVAFFPLTVISSFLELFVASTVVVVERA
jgi:hypothetical protein